MFVHSISRTVRLFVFGIFLLVVISLPSFASAHSAYEYQINGSSYGIVIGSVNEPLIVDDKSGVDFRITKNGLPLAAVQESLKVEISAGEKAKTLEFSPVHGEEGQYRALFFPTIATTLSYRVFGTLDGVPFDVTYTCNAAGHPQVEENTTPTTISEGVVQTLSRGAFSCPQEKAAFGFPEDSASIHSLSAEVDVVRDVVGSEESDDSSLPLVLGFVVLGLVLLAFYRNRRS